MHFKNLSLRNKIVLPAFFMVITILASSIWLMTDRAQNLAIDQAIDLANSEATSYSQDIMDDLTSAMSISRTLQAVFEEAVKANPIPTREYFAALLKQVLADNPEISGTWIVCRPGQFDDREEESKAVWNGAMRVYHYREKQGIVTSYEGTEKMEGDWFDIPMGGRDETITKPYPWEINGVTNWLTSTGLPVQKNNKNIGVVGVDFYITDLQAMVKKIRPFETGYAILTGNDGTIIAHPDDKMLGKNLGDIVAPEHKQKHLRAITAGHPYSYIAPSPATGEMEYVTAKPISIGKAHTPWSLSVAIPLDAVKRQAHSVAKTGVMIGVIAMVVLLALLFLLSRVITRPVLQTSRYTQKVAEGDLNAVLDIDQKDEIGVMAVSLQIMVSKLKETISEAKSKTHEAEKESAKATRAMAEAEKARQEAITARSEGLLLAANRVAKVLERVVSASMQMSQQSEGLLHGAQEQSDRITSTATAMEEMNATVLEIARNASEASAMGVEAQNTAQTGASVVDQSKQAMKSTMAEVTRLNENMRKLDEQAQGIGAIIGVINDIADQTNLLALNAAIEAARAGEAGRGFAVVADEVRKLAEKTMQATKEVSSSIQAIQHVADTNIHAMESVVSHVGTATKLSNNSGEMLRDIVRNADASATQISGIATAADEQSATSEEISRAIEQVRVITNQTADSAREFSRAIGSLEEQIQELNGIVGDLKKEGSVD